MQLTVSHFYLNQINVQSLISHQQIVVKYCCNYDDLLHIRLTANVFKAVRVNHQGSMHKNSESKQSNLGLSARLGGRRSHWARAPDLRAS